MPARAKNGDFAQIRVNPPFISPSLSSSLPILVAL
jgi:hypothetical protein